MLSASQYPSIPLQAHTLLNMQHLHIEILSYITPLREKKGDTYILHSFCKDPTKQRITQWRYTVPPEPLRCHFREGK